MTRPRCAVVLTAVLVTVLGTLAPALAAHPAAPADPVGALGPQSTGPPRVLGRPVVDASLRATRGRWDAGEHAEDDLTYTYRWRRDDHRIAGATDQRYHPRVRDLGHHLTVRVVATDPDAAQGAATSVPGRAVRKAVLALRHRPSVAGVLRFTHTLSATPGRWDRRPTRVRYRWLRAGEPVPGADGRRRTIAPADVGHRLRVQVRVSRPGYRWSRALSPRQPRVAHRVAASRSVSYHLETRGRVTADLGTFARVAAQTYADPRGWRGGGTRFHRVASGGSFTLVLAEASTLPSFSPVCSTQWSCRVGRYVVINQTRWRHASETWNRAGRSLEDYRHLVLNHETGHWLGRDHASCPGPGRLAPVMMQQSISTDGCRLNPWPTLAEQGS